MVSKIISLKDRYFRFKQGHADVGFDYETFKARSHSSASDSTNSIDEDIFDLPASPPVHPIATMQGAFEESMRFPDVDIENAVNPRKYDLRYHPLIKLVAQISFGLHLLHKRLAKSEQEVVKILQRHVDDMNKFLNRTTRNFDLATSDIEERHKNLKTALDNSQVFEKMLVSDPAFRTQISDGNRKVEYVIKKTTVAMEKSLRDVYEGMRGVDELGRYLVSLKKGWKNTGLIRTYGAMTSNVEVWARSLETLRKAGLNLGVQLEKLKTVVNQVEKKVRKTSKSAKGKYKAQSVNHIPADQLPVQGPKNRSSSTSSAPPDLSQPYKGLKHSRSMPGIPPRTSSLRTSPSLQRLNREEDVAPNPKRAKNIAEADNEDDDDFLPLQLPGQAVAPPPPPAYQPSSRLGVHSPTPLDRIVETQLSPLHASMPTHQWKPLPPTPPSPSSSNPRSVQPAEDDEETGEVRSSPVIIELFHSMGEFDPNMNGDLQLRPIFEISRPATPVESRPPTPPPDEPISFPKADTPTVPLSRDPFSSF